MVSTRASSREVTPAEPIRDYGSTSMSQRLRTSTRRSTTADSQTPGGRSRTRKSGPTAAARSGNTSHAYGTGTNAVSSRVAGRAQQQQGFASVFDEILVEQDENERDEDDILETVMEEEHGRSREASVADSSPSALPSAIFDNKRFAGKREEGLAGRSNMPTAAHFPEHLIVQPSKFDRLKAKVISGFETAKGFFITHQKLILYILLASILLPLATLALYTVFTHLSPFSTDGSLTSPVFDTPGNTPGSSGTTTVTSYISSATNRALTNRLNHLESRVTFLEEELARLPHTPPAIPFNHIAASLGATIIPGLTSPTKRTVSALLIPLSKFFTPPGMKAPITALQPWSEPGECWCAPGDRASLGVRAAYPIRADALTIEHVLPADVEGSGWDLASAPRVVEVWGHADLDIGSGEEEEAMLCRSTRPAGRGWVCLGRMEVVHQRRTARGVTAELARRVVAQEFVVMVVENEGAVGATCVYRVGLHGVKIE